MKVVKRRLILAAVCIILVLGLPVIWLVRGFAPSDDSVTKTSQTAPTPPPPSPATDAAGKFDAKHFSLTDPTSIWVVVNKKRPLQPASYAPSDLAILSGGQYMRAEAATALSEMLTAAKSAGLAISAPSAYRSYDTQSFVYDKEVKANGQAVADSQSARPGYSEHQTGLSVDIAGGGCSITDCFATTAEGKWAAANAHTYGFILRYPSGKQDITGYRYEPWHFRYVGKELTAEMKRTGATTLESFFNLPAAPSY